MNIETIVVIVFLGVVYLLADFLELAFELYYAWSERRDRKKRVAAFYDKALLKSYQDKATLKKIGEGKLSPAHDVLDTYTWRYKNFPILKHPTPIVMLDIKA